MQLLFFQKKKIVTFEISSKKKIILISLKKNATSSDFENLGGEFYNLFKGEKSDQYFLNSDTITNKTTNNIGYFLHGLKLKSYKFDKYKTKKNTNNFSIVVTGKNKPMVSDQIKFKAIEDGTFYTRDLVSEPGNILHPDEYSKRIEQLRKIGIKVTIYDKKRLKKMR